ncbi:unnamed protein product [Fraxinus pennsylvanica]|uniref:Pentatricopeptide repeat-containing protein n=1 Tax=Fraxinus pennsylvanica TaxID=56036 RepID=A0AAD1Z7D8_9LAMI|nr:unnamed protein product [Fraxinus pennsylvanica]
MLSGFVQSREIVKARKLFDEMFERDVMSWNMMLSGSRFGSTISDFCVEPRVEHLASLVDIVSPFGLVEEAMDVIHGMPIEPDNAMWGALLALEKCTAMWIWLELQRKH